MSQYQFICPSCNSLIEVKNPTMAISVLCSHCRAHVDFLAKPVKLIGISKQCSSPTSKEFQLGMNSRFIDGDNTDIVGRVRYHNERDYVWDEWFAVADRGRYAWLTHDEGEGLVIWTPIISTQPNELIQTQTKEFIQLEGETVYITERGEQVIDCLEGELPWKFTIGNSMHYIIANSLSGKIFTAIWSGGYYQLFHAKVFSTSLTASSLDKRPQL